MTEEVKVTSNNDEGTQVPGEVTPLMQQALEQGWRPKEDFEGGEDEFIDYAEFVRRGELFRKIESQSKDMKEMRRALAEMSKHNSKIREVEYARAVADLKAQKKAAMNEGDFDKAEEIDDKIDLVKDQQRADAQAAVQAAIPQEVHPELQAWMNRNPWYNSDPKMKAYADVLGQQLGGSMSPTDVLKEVEKEVKERFKEKFSNPNRTKAGAVEGAPRTQTRADSKAEYELSDMERSVMNTLVKQGVITKEKYIADLKAIKEKN